MLFIHLFPLFISKLEPLQTLAENGFIFCQGGNETFRQFVIGQRTCEVVHEQLLQQLRQQLKCKVQSLPTLMKSQQLRNNSRACSTLRNMRKVHRITWISAEGPGRLLPGVRAETEWRTGNPGIICSRSGGYVLLLCLKLFPLGSQAKFAFFQDDCAQQFKFHWRYGAHVRFQWRHVASGCCVNARASSYRDPRCHRRSTHAATTTKSTTTMGQNYTSAARSVFAAGKAMRPQAKAKAISMTLVNTGKLCMLPSARCWLRHENRTRLNGPSSRQRSQSSWASRTLHERAARKASNEKRSTEILNTMGPEGSPNDNGTSRGKGRGRSCLQERNLV